MERRKCFLRPGRTIAAIPTGVVTRPGTQSFVTAANTLPLPALASFPRRTLRRSGSCPPGYEPAHRRAALMLRCALLRATRSARPSPPGAAHCLARTRTDRLGSADLPVGGLAGRRVGGPRRRRARPDRLGPLPLRFGHRYRERFDMHVGLGERTAFKEEQRRPR